MLHLIVCDLTVEEHIMCQDEYLLYILSFIFVVFQPDIVSANAKHLAHQSDHDKERTGVHAGNRIIDNHDFVLARIYLSLAAA
ncbi:hypothetical protein CGSMWGv1500E_03559 [Gardnerella vaginalis 1500E]|uniref:Uncharacterized protein n=1 Tax=Gardnerella vaginalis 1500E TaxID=698957 RepID=I4M0A2_GARVA|nr:hypothetical protein CGSMWGv1500E_03559 [Gardnerella vaginalis 1500E]